MLNPALYELNRYGCDGRVQFDRRKRVRYTRRTKGSFYPQCLDGMVGTGAARPQGGFRTPRTRAGATSWRVTHHTELKGTRSRLWRPGGGTAANHSGGTPRSTGTNPVARTKQVAYVLGVGGAGTTRLNTHRWLGPTIRSAGKAVRDQPAPGACPGKAASHGRGLRAGRGKAWVKKQRGPVDVDKNSDWSTTIWEPGRERRK